MDGTSQNHKFHCHQFYGTEFLTSKVCGVVHGQRQICKEPWELCGSEQSGSVLGACVTGTAQAFDSGMAPGFGTVKTCCCQKKRNGKVSKKKILNSLETLEN